ncbi:MAG TPA: hypothetical protein VN837_13245 [Chloroflexota bacterium]|nr:hypothetical protein [Chloroflexota bacterium]
MSRVETAITVEARVMGRHNPEIINQRVVLATSRPDGGVLRLRDVLAYLARAEVAAFAQRRQERRLLRVLSPDQIQQASASGKIVMTEFEEAQANPEADEDAAVTAALQAFEDGLYFVFLDDGQLEDLDAPAPVRDGSTLTFIRLVALAGG